MSMTNNDYHAPILHLNLTKKWFDIIGNPKHEEYRTINQYWSRIFINGKIKIKGKYYLPADIIVGCSNGYAMKRPQKLFRIIDLKTGFGNPAWGAKPNTQYFILIIGEQLL